MHESAQNLIAIIQVDINKFKLRNKLIFKRGQEQMS